MLNKQKGNMYPWVTHTWNPIKGKCPHDCIYCYMKAYKQPELHLDEKELKTDLGQGNIIFVGSSCDMWAKEVSSNWKYKVLQHCEKYLTNRYLFQTKNPSGFGGWQFPPNTILGITLESNRAIMDISKAPLPLARVVAFATLNYPKMVSIEPILDFDLDLLVSEISMIAPEFVSIGADSQRHHLSEPSGGKIRELIDALQGITIVKQKDNLKRLLKQTWVCR